MILALFALSFYWSFVVDTKYVSLMSAICTVLGTSLIDLTWIFFCKCDRNKIFISLLVNLHKREILRVQTRAWNWRPIQNIAGRAVFCFMEQFSSWKVWSLWQKFVEALSDIWQVMVNVMFVTKLSYFLSHKFFIVSWLWTKNHSLSRGSDYFSRER